jgi:precorrin-6B methylase 2
MSDLTALELAKAFGYLYENEVHYLKELANMLDMNPTIINIGAGSGTSSLTFLESRTDAKVITVDKQKEGSPLGSLEGEMNAINQSKYAGTTRLTHIHGDSKLVHHEEYHYDMVFVDGDHSFEGCTGDIKAWIKHLLDNANTGRVSIMAFHDYEAAVWPDVYKAVEKEMIKYKRIRTVDTVTAFRIK